MSLSGVRMARYQGRPHPVLTTDHAVPGQDVSFRQGRMEPRPFRDQRPESATIETGSALAMADPMLNRRLSVVW